MTTITISDETHFDKTHFSSIEELQEYIQDQLLAKELSPVHREILDDRMRSIKYQPENAMTLQELKSSISRK